MTGIVAIVSTPTPGAYSHIGNDNFELDLRIVEVLNELLTAEKKKMIIMQFEHSARRS